MNFCRGDRVVVEGNLMGTVVEEWIHSNNQPYYKVYVDYFREIREYDENVINRCLIRHKYLSGEELLWQDNAINNR